MKKNISIFILTSILSIQSSLAQGLKDLKIIAYYSAGPDLVEGLPASKLSHIIYSFCHLKGSRLMVDNARDSSTIRKLVALKSANPQLKVMISLGGWGGCEPCSDVFSTAAGRAEFALSVLQLNQYFGTDGLDLDWEYPVVEGFPGHPFKSEDRANFTALIQALRKTLGVKYEISFAAGGFQKYLDEAIDWATVMPILDRVNVMSYDLVGGYATVTGHHTPLYSTLTQRESTDNAVQYLVKIGVDRKKIVIGGAFYARVWENVPDVNHGLNQPGKFKQAVDYRDFAKAFDDFDNYWDDIAQAPYRYHRAKKLFATYDDERSIARKTKYAIDQKLNGIMFWELSLDKKVGGMLDAITKVKEDSHR